MGSSGLDDNYGYGLVNASESLRISTYYKNNTFVNGEDDSMIFNVSVGDANRDLVVTVVWSDNITQANKFNLTAIQPDGQIVTTVSPSDMNNIQYINTTYKIGTWQFVLNESSMTDSQMKFAIAANYPITGPYYQIDELYPVEDGNYTAAAFQIKARIFDGDGETVSSRFTENVPTFNLTKYSDDSMVINGSLETVQSTYFFNASSSWVPNPLGVGRYKVNITAQNQTRIATKTITFNIISGISFAVKKPTVAKYMRGDVFNFTVSVTGNSTELVYVNYSLSFPNGTIKDNGNLTQHDGIAVYENSTLSFSNADPEGSYLVQMWAKDSDSEGYSSFNAELNKTFILDWLISDWTTTDTFYFLPVQAIWINGTVNHTNTSGMSGLTVEVYCNSSTYSAGWNKNITTTDSNGEFTGKINVNDSVGAYELVVNITDSNNNQRINTYLLYVSNYVGNASSTILYSQTNYATLNDTIPFLILVTNDTGSVVYRSNVTITNTTLGISGSGFTNSSGYVQINWTVPETTANDTFFVNISANGPFSNNETSNSTDLVIRKLVIVFNETPYYIKPSNHSIPMVAFVYNYTGGQMINGGSFNVSLSGHYYNGSKICGMESLSNYSVSNKSMFVGGNGNLTVNTVPLPNHDVRGTYNITVLVTNTSGSDTLRGYNTTKVYSGICSDGEVYDKYNKGSSENETHNANLIINPSEGLTFRGYVYYGVRRDVVDSSIANVSIRFDINNISGPTPETYSNDTINTTNNANGYSTGGITAPSGLSHYEVTVDINDTTHDISSITNDDFSFELWINNTLNASNLYFASYIEGISTPWDAYDINSPPKVDYNGNLTMKGDVYFLNSSGFQVASITASPENREGNISIVDIGAETVTYCGKVNSTLADFECIVALGDMLSSDSRPIGRNSSYTKLYIDDEYGLEGNMTIKLWVRDLNITDSEKRGSDKTGQDMFSDTTITVGDATTVRGYVYYRNENVSGLPRPANVSTNIYILDSDCRQDGSAADDDHDYNYPAWSSSMDTTDATGYFSFSYYPNCTGNVDIRIRATDGDNIRAQITSNAITVSSASSSASSGSSTTPVATTTTTVERVYLAITDYPSSVSVEENKTTVANITVTSKYDVSQSVKLAVLDIISSWYSVSPASKTISGLDTGKFEVTFSGVDVEVGNYDGKFNASSSYDSHTVDFTLKVTPSPKTQVTINDSLLEYESQMLTLESQINQSKDQNYNMSLAEDKLDELKRQINLAKAYRDRGDYTSAYNLFTGISVLINETQDAVLEANPTIGEGTWWNWGKWVIGGVVVVGIGVVAYLFWPAAAPKLPSIKAGAEKYVYQPHSKIKEKVSKKVDKVKKKYKHAVNKVKEKVGGEKPWRRKK